MAGPSRLLLLLLLLLLLVQTQREQLRVKEGMRKHPPAAAARQDDLTTPLLLAVAYGAPGEAVQALLGAGADPNEGELVTPLGAALRDNAASLEVVLRLLRAGANPNLDTKVGGAPLVVALKHNASLEVLKALVDAGATVPSLEAGLKAAKRHPQLKEVEALLKSRGVGGFSSTTTTPTIQRNDPEDEPPPPPAPEVDAYFSALGLQTPPYRVVEPVSLAMTIFELHAKAAPTTLVPYDAVSESFMAISAKRKA